MPKRKNSGVEIVPASALVPQPSLQAMIQEMVARQVSEIIQSGSMELQPDFEAREVAIAIMKLQGVWDRKKWPRYYEKWGCRRCDQTAAPHTGLGYCRKCYHLFVERLKQLRLEWDRERPQRLEEVDAITRRVRSAERLLGNARPRRMEE
jgi:hypothetical protein